MDEDVALIANWIKRGRHSRVGIQCPDHLLCHAPTLCARVGALCEALVFVLGDTSYQSCCVDEVSAQHYGADAIVHIGESCQSRSGSIPTLFIFERLPAPVLDADLPAAVQKRGVLIYETNAYHHEASIIEKLRLPFVARPVLEADIRSTRFRRLPWYVLCPIWRSLMRWKPIKVCGRTVFRSSTNEVAPLPTDPIFVYIGAPDSMLERRLLLRWADCAQVYREGVKIESDALLARRYGAVQAAKSAEFFGIIVGSVAVEGVLDACSRIEKILDKNGKKSVRLFVGKLSVAKLGNVPEVNCFVLVSCPHHEALYTREYPKPIVTPFDIEVAFDAREWSTEYKLDLNELLHHPVDWSRYDLTKHATDIVAWNQSALIANESRTWGGLDTDSKVPVFAIAGEHGVASKYEGERT